MTETAPTSREHLETMLRDGRISHSEFETLRAAIESAPARPIPAAGDQTRLTKSWRGRQLGGVCAGLGNHFRIDPIVFRVLFVLILLASGGAALIAYLILYAYLPWDESESASIPRFSWPFAGGAAALIAGNMVLAHIFNPSLLVNLFDNLGETLPRFSIPAFRIVRALEYQPVSWIFVIIGAAIITCVYSTAKPMGLMRRIIAWAFIIAMTYPAVGYFVALMAAQTRS